jgi:hypothetical protein
MRFVFLAATAFLAATVPAIAQTCAVDMAAVEAEIASLEPSYGEVLSDIACDAPTILAHQMMCDTAGLPDADLWRMGRLGDLAWLYAYENATKTEVDRANPPVNDRFIAARDACTDAACLCNVLIDFTNDSLGGLTPYPN